MDSRYKLLSELLSDQAAFITSPKTSFANYWGHCPCPPVSTGLDSNKTSKTCLLAHVKKRTCEHGYSVYFRGVAAVFELNHGIAVGSLVFIVDCDS